MESKRTSAHTKKGERAQPQKNKDRTDTELKLGERERVGVVAGDSHHLGTIKVELQDSYSCGK
jgi:hypothetical protein